MFSYGMQHAVGQSPPNPQHNQHYENEIKFRTSVAIAREGLLGKACQVLTSSGVASDPISLISDLKGQKIGFRCNILLDLVGFTNGLDLDNSL